MYTLQILDGGQTFLHTLDDQALRIGSGEDVGLRLTESGVRPLHATLVPRADGLALQAHGPVLLNGQGAKAALLVLGDRLELGKAVLVVGRSVARAARPEDVLGEAVSRRRPERRRSAARFLPLVGAAIAIAIVVALVWNSDDRAEVRGEVAVIARLRGAGELEAASAAIAKLRPKWQGAPDDRLQRLDAEQAAIAATEATVERLRQSVLDPTDTRTFAAWIRELRSREDGDDPIERTAARLVRGKLNELLDARSVRAAALVANESDIAGAGALPAAAPPAAMQALLDDGPSVPSPGQTAARAAALVTAALESVDRLEQQEQFAQALAVIDACIGDVDPAGVVTLQRRAEGVRQRAAAALPGLLAAAATAAKTGDCEAADDLLGAALPRFPDGPEFAALTAASEAAHAALLAQRAATLAPAAATSPSSMAKLDTHVALPPVDPAQRTATLERLREQMGRIHDAEERGDFAASAQLLRSAADTIRERDADFAARLADRAEDAEVRQAWHAQVASTLKSGRELAARTRDGRAARLTGVDGAVLLGVAGTAELRLSWSDFGADGLQALAQQVAPHDDAAIGAASLLYEASAAPKAEALLAGLVRGNPSNKPRIDRAIARGRGEAYDARGYDLGKNGFESARSVDVAKLGKKLEARLEAALRAPDRTVRDGFVAAVLAEGAEARDPLALCLEQEFVRRIEKLDTGPLRKQVEHLAEQRELLDTARAAAKKLIYDEVEYFYPYKPPAVSGERFAKYNEVQAEVDRRVDEVRRLWDDEHTKVHVPPSLEQDLDRIDWLAASLQKLGRPNDLRAHVDWTRGLPPGKTVTIRDYCRSGGEGRELADWRRVEAYNTAFVKNVGAAVRELLKVTNEYRAMFRHQPLALVAALDESAQGHADEMARLGYFAHFSEVPGRRTPFDRMKLAGYNGGASENIALNDSAPMAHYAWCHSSGHHRCLLNPGYTEVGLGNSGRLWVQNFGTGRARFADPAWAATAK